MLDALTNTPPATVAPIPADGVPEVLGNIARDLQGQVLRYRWFGVWWWPIKVLLLGAGYGPNLPMLRHYMDPEAVAALPRPLTPGQVLAEGLAYYQYAARLARHQEWVETPDGDMIRIYDADIET